METYGWEDFPLADPAQYPGGYKDFLENQPSTKAFWEDQLMREPMPVAQEGTLPQYAYPGSKVEDPDPEFSKGTVPNPPRTPFEMGKGVINPKFEQPVRSSIGTLPETYAEDNWSSFPQVA